MCRRNMNVGVRVNLGDLCVGLASVSQQQTFIAGDYVQLQGWEAWLHAHLIGKLKSINIC